MAKVQLVSAQNPPSGDHNPSVGSPAPATGLLDTTEVNEMVGRSIDQVREEVSDAFADMRTFFHREPDEIMRMCGGHSARLSELRVLVMRIEDFRREWRSIRTRELEPAIEELQRQYQIASRLHSVRELDWKMESGERG